MTKTLAPTITARTALRLAAPERVRDEAVAWRDVYVEALGPRPHRVLVVGAGSGDAAFALWRLGHYPQGIDPSPDAVHRARARARERCAAVPFQVGDAEDLDFPAGVFHAVVALDVLGGLAHPAWALAEWFRVLKPGGIAVVGATSPTEPGRVRAADFLRFTGFADVESRSACAAEARDRAPWYRRIATRARPAGDVAWGVRPS